MGSTRTSSGGVYTGHIRFIGVKPAGRSNPIAGLRVTCEPKESGCFLGRFEPLT